MPLAYYGAWMESRSQMSSYASASAIARRDYLPDDILDLLRMRAQVRQQIASGRQELGRLAKEADRIESSIARLTGVARQQVNHLEQAQSAGELNLLIFKALEVAQRPLNAREITRKVMTDMGLDADDQNVRAPILRRISVCLWTQTQKKRLRKSEPKTSPTKWELVEFNTPLTRSL